MLKTIMYVLDPRYKFIFVQVPGLRTGRYKRVARAKAKNCQVVSRIRMLKSYLDI